MEENEYQKNKIEQILPWISPLKAFQTNHSIVVRQIVF